MSRSGSFGVNFKKSYGSTPSIIESKLGEIGSNIDGEWVYVLASATVNLYDFVAITGTNTVAPLTTTTAGSSTLQIGVAQAALASGEYGWVWIGGAMGGGIGLGIRGNVSAAVGTAGANLNTTATAGQVSTTSTTLIKNLAACATTTGAGSVELRSTGYLTVN